MTTTAANIEQKELPAGWKWVKLGDVCVEQRKTIRPDEPVARTLPYLSLEHVQSQTGLILASPEDIPEDAGKSNTFYFDESHILYGKLRPYLNKVALPNFTGRCTTELIPLKPTLANRDFLWWLLKRPETVSYSMMGKTGSRMPRANMTEFMQMEVPLPPLVEQKRIAGILNERMAAVEEAKKAAQERLEAVKALPAAYLREVLPSSEDELPAGWKWVKLGDACDKITDGSHFSPKTIQEGIPYITVKDLTDGKIDFLNCKKISEQDYEQLTNSGCRPNLGDILFSKDGTVGKTALIEEESQFVVLSSLAIITPNLNCVKPEFLYQYLSSDAFVKEATDSKTGMAIKRIVLKNLKLIKIPVPPLGEQKQIASELDDKIAGVKLAEASIQQELDTIEAMPAALLRKAFSGAL